MKVIIFAGGWGTRLGQLTESIPKPMVKIGNNPILWHIMKYYSTYGFNDFIICLGVKGEIIKNYFYNYHLRKNDFTIDLSNREITYHNSKSSEENWRISLIETGLNTLKGARLKKVEKYLDPEYNMLTYGDGLTDVNIKELVQFHKSHKKILTITGVHPPSRFGELTESDDKVISFQEKPQTSGNLINGGFMIFKNGLLNYLDESDKCDLEKGPFEQLASEGEIMVYKHKGNWECMDNEGDVKHLNKLWEDNQAFWKIWK